MLVDFIAELPQSETCPDNLDWWTLNIDGVSRQSGAGIGLQLRTPSGDKIKQSIWLGFSASNNESEYEAILAVLELATVVYADRLLIRSDSQLVVGQVNKEFESRDPRMAKYISQVKQHLNCFPDWKLEHVPRGSNEKADTLALVAASLPITETIFLPIYYKLDSSIASPQVNQVDKDPPSWMDPITLYLSTRQLPTERNKAHKLQIQAARFSLIDGQLFKRSFGGPYLKCLTPEQSQYVLAELHEGICENHSSSRTRAHGAHTQGYYWPTMKADVADYTRKCDRFQRLTPILKSPVQDLISITSPCPFAQWGIDIVRPLPTARAQKKLLLVATDYFSKWIEVEAFSSIKDRDVTQFIWKNIVCRFVIPKSIVSNNGPQFDSRVYQNLCQELKIKNLYSTPRYPQNNGLEKASNKTLIMALKKRLDSATGKWVDELPGVLWAYRTTARKPTGVSPFAITYGMEAIIPTKIGMPTIQTNTSEQGNTELTTKELDTVDEL